jgi:hypothetical protein
MVQFMYGWDMSPEATYTPVEADTLLTQYMRRASARTFPAGGTVFYSKAPSWTYADTVPSKLTNGTGGGFGQPLGSDWAGFAGNPAGAVTVTVDLGSPRSITDVRTLFAGSTVSGIYFPQAVLAEYSPDGLSWFPMGNSNGENAGIDTPPSYAVEWVDAANGTAVTASQVRVTVNFCEWLFVGEIKVISPESPARRRFAPANRAWVNRVDR